MDTDPLHDLERRLDRLESRLDLSNQAIKGEIEGMRDDIKRLEAADTGHVPMIRYLTVERVVYGFVALVLVAFVTAVVNVVL